MPTTLKSTDVAIIGMGAAGGVAALPLAQAGLGVVGIENTMVVTEEGLAPLSLFSDRITVI